MPEAIILNLTKRHSSGVEPSQLQFELAQQETNHVVQA